VAESEHRIVTPHQAAQNGPERIRQRLPRVWLAGLLVFVFGMGLAGGVVLDRQVLDAFVPPDNLPANATADFKLMADAWNTIQQNYVDPSSAQPQQLTYGAIGGMVDALGDTGHSRFLSPEMVKVEHEVTQGQFEGIGAEVETKDGHIVIVAPIDNSPAQHANLHPGDVILKVNGADVTGLPLAQVVSQILGPAGTSITLTILDPATGAMRDVTLQRASITLQNVTWQRLPGTTIADVRITAFSQGVTQDLEKVLSDIRAQGLTGIILDLRNDPGGLLDEAVGVSSQFLGSGNVLEEKDATGRVQEVPVKLGGQAIHVPLVVLVNQGTASAAEIVAGAIQDAHRAEIIGDTTFGTGTVLNEFKLPDGSALLLATEEWLTPKGRVIWHTGIAPDVVISLPADATLLLPETERAMTASQVRNSGDAPLLSALDLLERSATQVPSTMP